MAELEVQGLNVWYGAAQALFDVSLLVGAGELVVLQGLNGAGKSTLLQAIVGLSQRQTGVISYQKQSISDWPPHRRARAGLGYVAEDLLGLGPGVYRVQPFIAQQGGPVQGGVCFNLQQQLGHDAPWGWFGRFGFGGEDVTAAAAVQAAGN